MDQTAELSAASPAPSSPRSGRRRRLATLILGGLLVYFLIAYVLLPIDWMRYFRRHPSLADVPGITHTKDGIPGDPLNVALIGGKEQVEGIMLAARWYPANPLGVRSDLRIAEATVLKREYNEAPVSNLYLFGRKDRGHPRAQPTNAEKPPRT